MRRVLALFVLLLAPALGGAQLIQIAGRAARNVGGQVVLYADTRTGSMDRALNEMERRREKQLAYNKEHKITPKTIVKAVGELEEFQNAAKREGLAILREAEKAITAKDVPILAEEIEKRMKEAADNLDFELAAALRDQLFELRQMTAMKGKGAATTVPKVRKMKK